MLLAIVLLAVSTARCRALNDADEYDIRAAMLINITRFVEWPAWKVNAQNPQISICVVGIDPIAPSLDHLLQSETSSPIKIHHLGSFDAATSCQVLYVSLHEQKSLKQLAPKLSKAAVLVVSEEPNATSPNQIIGLPTEDEHVHIDVNLAAAKLAGITISSKLLHLATVTR